MIRHRDDNRASALQLRGSAVRLLIEAKHSDARARDWNTLLPKHSRDHQALAAGNNSLPIDTAHGHWLSRNGGYCCTLRSPQRRRGPCHDLPKCMPLGSNNVYVRSDEIVQLSDVLAS